MYRAYHGGKRGTHDFVVPPRCGAGTLLRMTDTIAYPTVNGCKHALRENLRSDVVPVVERSGATDNSIVKGTRDL